jgi:hypothetical protein
MADIVQSLFGVTPEMYQQRQAQQADAAAMQFAQLSPMQQAQYGIARGAYGLAGALGAPDPQLQMISARNAIARQIDYNNPESIMQGVNALSQAGDTMGAMQLADVARKMESEMAQRAQRLSAARASEAAAEKTRLGIEQENKLRAELSQLGAGATEEQIRGVLVKYGDPDKVLTALQTAATRDQDRQARADAAAAANEARAATAAAANEARVEAARIAAEARLQAARDAGATRVELARIAQENKKDLAQLSASLKGPKVLAPGLQKEEDKDLEQIDNFEARKTALAPALQALTPDPKTGRPFLELGPLKNTQYMAQNLAGNSTEQSRAFANLQRSVQEATNLKTDAAKGVQTDKDVLRFANELIAAFGKYDTKTTLEALTNFRNATQTAQDRTKVRIDSRRKAQNVEPYFGAAARGTAQNPIKLD